MCIRDSYDAVQKAIDKAEFWGADTIIGLGHLGVDPSSSPWTLSLIHISTRGAGAKRLRGLVQQNNG